MVFGVEIPILFINIKNDQRVRKILRINDILNLVVCSILEIKFIYFELISFTLTK